jgi:hypothetical protein
MNSPTHEEIALQAQWLWRDRGCPEGLDDQIWLEAERQLKDKSNGSAKRTPDEITERAKSETAAESMVEYHISPPVSEQEAIRASMMKQEARAPKTPKRNAPKPKPPESGKPVWDRPHSR